MKKHFIIKCDVYPFDIYISMGEKLSLVKKELKLIAPEDVHDEIDLLEMRNVASTITLSCGATIIIFNKFTNDIIAHEVFHAAFGIMKQIGCTLSDSSEEAFAYLIEFITRKINENIKNNSLGRAL